MTKAATRHSTLDKTDMWRSNLYSLPKTLVSKRLKLDTFFPYPQNEGGGTEDPMGSTTTAALLALGLTLAIGFFSGCERKNDVAIVSKPMGSEPFGAVPAVPAGIYLQGVGDVDAGTPACEHFGKLFSTCDFPTLPITMRGYAVLDRIIESDSCTAYFVADDVSIEEFTGKFAILDRTGNPLKSKGSAPLTIKTFNDMLPAKERPFDEENVAESGYIRWGKSDGHRERTSCYVLTKDSRLLWEVSSFPVDD